VRRRDFITVLGGAAGWPLAARAQQTKLPVVGFLNGESAPPYRSRLAAFRTGLNDAGYVESKSVTVEYRFAEGQRDRLPALAADLVRRQVAVLVASGGSQLAAKAATTAIPIVFAVGDDPVKSGLVASLARPGGNLTGVTSFAGELGPKRLGLLHELLPRATRIGLLQRSGASSETQTDDLQRAARALGLVLHVFAVTVESDIDAGFASISGQRDAALIVDNNLIFLSRMDQLIVLAARHSVPTIFPWREFAQAGGLMSYSTSDPDVFRNVGLYTGRIIGGAKPGDLPVLLPTKFEFVINLRTAKILGLSIPPTLLAIADEVIE